MGNIFKLQNGRYKVDVYDLNGVRHRPHFNKKSHAEAFVSRIDNEKYERRLIEKGLKPERVKFVTAIEEYERTKEELREKTRRKYSYILEQFQNFVDALELTYIDEFTREHADIFRANLFETGAAPKTINHYLLTVKALFEYQVVRDRLIKSPMSHLDMAREKRKTLIERENDYYKEDEIKSFIGSIDTEWVRDAFRGLFLTGCRINEFINLTWDISIDFENKMIRIRNTEVFEGKTPSAERDIPMTDGLFWLLKKRKENTKSKYVFTNSKDKPLKMRTMLQKCKDIAEKAGIEKNATLHKWRHTFSSFLQRTGIDYQERQYIMGHKPESITDHYTKIDPKLLHEKINQLDRYVF